MPLSLISLKMNKNNKDELEWRVAGEGWEWCIKRAKPKRG